MKTLLLLRHAESSGTEAGQSDFARPLNERGREAAPAIGRFLGRQRVKPDLILCSPAERARETATLVIDAAGLTSSKLRDDARIYEAATATLFEVVSQIEEGAREVLIVGHNPGISELLARLTGEERPIRTASLVCISLDIEKWREVREQTGRLAWLVAPEELA